MKFFRIIMILFVVFVGCGNEEKRSHFMVNSKEGRFFKYYRVTASALNMRDKADINAKVVQSLSRCSIVSFINKTDLYHSVKGKRFLWIKVSSETGLQGYMSSKYLKGIEGATAARDSEQFFRLLCGTNKQDISYRSARKYRIGDGGRSMLAESVLFFSITNRCLSVGYKYNFDYAAEKIVSIHKAGKAHNIFVKDDNSGAINYLRLKILQKGKLINLLYSKKSVTLNGRYSLGEPRYISVTY